MPDKWDKRWSKRRPSRRAIKLALGLYAGTGQDTMTKDTNEMTKQNLHPKANANAAANEAAGASNTDGTERDAGGVQQSTAQAIELRIPGETGVYQVPFEVLQEFGEIIHEIEQGFAGFVAAGKVFDRNEAGETFTIIDGFTTQLLNKRDGVLEDKHVYTLEMADKDGKPLDVVRVMQSDTNIRAKYARAFILARATQGVSQIRMGPMRFEKRPAKINESIIFVPLPGFKPEVVYA